MGFGPLVGMRVYGRETSYTIALFSCNNQQESKPMSRRMIPPVLRAYFSSRLDEMMRTVQSLHYPQMTAPELYDDLINEPALAKLLRKAASYLPGNSVTKSVTATLGDREFIIRINLNPTTTDRAYLIPVEIDIDPESRLGRSLAEQYDSHMAWATTIALFKKMSENAPLDVVMFCMPWLRDMALDLKAQLDKRGTYDGNASYRWRDVFRAASVGMDKSETERAEKSLAAMIARRLPTELPAMTVELRAACRAGDTLTSQYRMLASSGYEYDYSADCIRLSFNTLSMHILADVAELLRDWHNPEGN